MNRLAAASLALLAVPAHGQAVVPGVLDGASDHERLVVQQLLADTSKPDLTSPERLAILDAGLNKLDRPSPARGLVQYLRATVQSSISIASAREAVIESIRLLPDIAEPLVLASVIYGYNDEPGIATDYLLRASRINPELVRGMEEYEINNLFFRLDEQRDLDRANLLAERLLQIEWIGEEVDSTSELAERVITAKVRAGNTSAARLLLPKLTHPASAFVMMIDRRFEMLWPDLERWAGPRLQNLWPAALREARELWTATGDLERAKSYAGWLQRAGHYDTIIRELYPLFAQPIDPESDESLLLMAAEVGEALAQRGRWADLETLYANAYEVWPKGSRAQHLNLYANHAGFLMRSDRPAEALILIDEAIRDAAKWRGEVNQGAVAGMHVVRACALLQLGYEPEAMESKVRAQAGSIKDRVAVELCYNDLNAAKAMLIAALDDPSWRNYALSFVQGGANPSYPSRTARMLEERAFQLRQDKDLRAAVAKQGRILDFDVSEVAPEELSATTPI